MTSRHTAFTFAIAIAFVLAACAEATPIAPAPLANESATTTTLSASIDAPAQPIPATSPAVDQLALGVPATVVLTQTAIPTPLVQHIVVDTPTQGAMLSNPFSLHGNVALTPQDSQLAYVLKDGAGAMITSGMVVVQGDQGQPGVFSATVSYPPALPGPARLEVLAVDSTSAVEAQIPSLVVNPQKGITLNLNGLAANASGQIVPGTPNAARAWVELNGMPRHLRVLFGGEATAETFTPHQRQLLVLPLSGYRALFKGAEAQRFDETVQSLKELLTTRPPTLTRELLLLPASDQSQAWQAHVRYLDFNGGGGVRFITYLTQELEPFNSSKLVYAFQGLTDDGQHLVSAYVPISSTLLAATPQDVSKDERERFKRGYADYRAETIAALEQAPASFTPSLAVLDGMIESLQIGGDLFEQTAAAPLTTASHSGKTTERLNLRSGPGADFRRLRQLAAGEQLALLQRSADNQWLQVRTDDGVMGWVSSQYVQPNGDVSVLPIAR